MGNSDITWEQFKKIVEAQGVTEGMIISCIDMSGAYKPRVEIFETSQAVQITNGELLVKWDNEDELPGMEFSR